ncbi:sugar phosphate isomerase/epimerase family protein [Agilicoccus flavus]|uniref:sugar phosphate isomerase/epimerase family protein n=1 Tax=Agilicoccus flavus TaxID=2775968 RepID=UPI001CF6C603|nr:sugar phosphate isomerase/epimerase [Agilicoccus flavus]
MSAAARVAVNPIPYWARPDGVDKRPEVFEEAFEDYRRIGIRAVKADVPDGMSAARYREWIGSYGLEPAISTVMAPLRDEDPAGGAGTDAAPAPGGADRLRRFAADQLELGNTATMVIAPMTPDRTAAPPSTRGADLDARRIEATTRGLAAVCDVLRGEGLFPALHQHVGSLVESEAETRHVLETLGAERIGFAPDSGHLAWAGADPAALVGEYADRVVGVHVKDVFPDHLGGTPTLDYHAVGATRRLWAEPGLGVVDLTAFLAALPAGFDGDIMIEVDVPSVESRYESARMAHEWAVARLGAA